MYDTAGVERRTLEVAVSSAGIVEPLATVEVKSKASGEVLDVLVSTGDHVEEGSLMVSIDPRIVRNRLAQSDAELKAAISGREIAITQKKRVESLVTKGTLTQSDLEQATLDLANAEAQVVTARVSVENARIAVDESAVQIRSLVDETDIGKIRPGMEAKVSVAAYPNQPFPGEVIKIEPQAVIEQNVTMFAVLVSIQNPDGLLMPGMNAEVEVSIVRAEDVMTIPVMALRTNRDLDSTAFILDRSVEDIRSELSGGEEKPAARAGDLPMDRSKRGRRQQATDYRFGGEFWVVLDTPGREIRKVRTGVTDLDNVEVVGGLDEDDRVLVLPSSHLLETQQDLQNFINRRMGKLPGIG
jgi:HlyD family secretion protein